MEHRLPYVYVQGEYEKLERYVEDEIDQLEQSGSDTTLAAAQLVELNNSPDAAGLREIEASLGDLARRQDFNYEEPSDYDAIVAARRNGSARLTSIPSGDELYDRLLGAWLGRCAGNCLGRPVENWSRGEIESRLRLTGDFSLSNYFLMHGAISLPDEWVSPLNDRIDSDLTGFHGSRISDLARRTMALIE